MMPSHAVVHCVARDLRRTGKFWLLPAAKSHAVFAAAKKDLTVRRGAS